MPYPSQIVLFGILRCAHGGHIGVDILLPHSAPGEEVSGHVESMGGVWRDGRVFFSSRQAFLSELRTIGRVNDVVCESGMIGMCLEAGFEDIERLARLVTGNEGKAIEGGRLDVV